MAALRDKDNTFTYQFITGASYVFNDKLSLYANYRYRDAQDASFDASLLPARFDVRNKNDIIDIGLCYNF